MSRSKFQVAVVSTAVVAGAMILQNALPQVAHDLGLTYLRAEYRLAKGDKNAALELMRASQPASAPVLQAAMTTAPANRPAACPSRAKVKPAVKRVFGPAVPPVKIELAGLRVPMKFTVPIPDHNANWARERYERQMRTLEAKLKNLRVNSPAVWPASVPGAVN